MHIRPSARRAICAAATVSLAAASLARAADVNSEWFGGNAFWDNPALWINTPSVTEYPSNGNGGLTYDVVVGAGTVDQAGDYTIDALTLSGGSINGTSFNLNLNQAFNWSAGNLSGSGTVLANAGFNINSGAAK